MVLFVRIIKIPIYKYKYLLEEIPKTRSLPVSVAMNFLFAFLFLFPFPSIGPVSVTSDSTPDIYVVHSVYESVKKMDKREFHISYLAFTFVSTHFFYIIQFW